MPSGVDELSPGYVASAPIDPFSGKPVQLAAEAGALRVFSVGKERDGQPIEIRIALGAR